MLNNPKTYIFLRQFHPRPRMSTEVKATLTIKNDPNWIEVMLLKDRVVGWCIEFALELEGLKLELDGEKVYES